MNKFISFLAAMMLAYQPVRSLSTLNIVINQGFAAASRILPIVDTKNLIKNSENAKEIKVSEGKITFENICFKYESSQKNILEDINLEFEGGKMTALVGHSGSGKSTILNLIQDFMKHILAILKLMTNQFITQLRNFKKKYIFGWRNNSI